MENEQRIAAIFDELNRAPRRPVDTYWTGEVLVATLLGALLICGTMLFWPELRLLLIHWLQQSAH